MTAHDPGTPTPVELDKTYGGHEFEYESHTDLFRCTECRTYEVSALAGLDGMIRPCPGLAAWHGDPERVYLLLTQADVPGEPYSPPLSLLVRETGLGRAPRYSRRGGRQLIETAPSVVDELARRIKAMTYTVAGRQVAAASEIQRLTAAAGQAVIAENHAAYVAEYGEQAADEESGR